MAVGLEEPAELGARGGRRRRASSGLAVEQRGLAPGAEGRRSGRRPARRARWIAAWSPAPMAWWARWTTSPSSPSASSARRVELPAPQRRHRLLDGLAAEVVAERLRAPPTSTSRPARRHSSTRGGVAVADRLHDAGSAVTARPRTAAASRASRAAPLRGAAVGEDHLAHRLAGSVPASVSRVSTRKKGLPPVLAWSGLGVEGSVADQRWRTASTESGGEVDPGDVRTGEGADGAAHGVVVGRRRRGG